MVDMVINSVWANGLYWKLNVRTARHPHPGPLPEGKGGKLDSPGFADRFGTQPIGFGVIHKFVLLEIVIELAIEREGDVRCMAGDVREAGRVGVCLRLAA